MTGFPDEYPPALVAEVDAIFPSGFDWEDDFVLDVFADTEDIEATTRALLSFAPHLGVIEGDL